jgi:hypothetical protein
VVESSAISCTVLHRQSAMMMKKIRPFITHLLAVLVGIGIGSFLLFLGLSEMIHESSEYELPQRITVKKQSPTGEHIAKILYEEKSKSYFLAIEANSGMQTILDKKLVPYIGYHDPLITLSWRNADIVIIEVDHDFGTGNLLYEFNTRKMDFKQVSSNSTLNQDAQ